MKILLPLSTFFDFYAVFAHLVFLAVKSEYTVCLFMCIYGKYACAVQYSGNWLMRNPGCTEIQFLLRIFLGKNIVLCIIIIMLYSHNVTE